MWSEGTLTCPETGRKYKFWVKHYEEGSEYGIDGGKISKLTIQAAGASSSPQGERPARKVGENRDLCNYDREWDLQPTDEVRAVYAAILEKYN